MAKRNVNKTDLQHGDLAPTTNGVHPMVWAALIAEHTWAADSLPSLVRRPFSSDAKNEKRIKIFVRELFGVKNSLYIT